MSDAFGDVPSEIATLRQVVADLTRERDAARALLNGDDVTAYEMKAAAEDRVAAAEEAWTALRSALEKAIGNERRLYDECRVRLWGMDREHYYCMDVLRDILRAAPLAPACPEGEGEGGA